MLKDSNDKLFTPVRERALVKRPDHLPLSNLERWRQVLNESGLDAVVAVSPENVPYLSGVFIDTQRTIRDRLALVVWPADGKPVLIVCSIEEPQAAAEAWIDDVRAYVEFQQSPVELLGEVLEEKGLADKRIGIELSYLSAQYFNELTQRLPRARFVPSEPLFDRTRYVKTTSEIELLKSAANRTEKALHAVFTTINPGLSEKNMANRLYNNLLEGGAEAVGFLYINAGPNTGYPHCKATGYAAQSGDIVKSDVGGIYSGYCSDVARTGVLGKPNPEQRSIYNRLMSVHQDTIAAARPGATAAEVFHTARRAYAREGLHFPLPHAGHSVGISVHEWPMLSPAHEVELVPDVLLYIETRVRWQGKVGYHVEDLVHVTGEGPQVLTTFFPTGELFEI